MLRMPRGDGRRRFGRGRETVTLMTGYTVGRCYGVSDLRHGRYTGVRDSVFYFTLPKGWSFSIFSIFLVLFDRVVCSLSCANALVYLPLRTHF